MFDIARLETVLTASQSPNASKEERAFARIYMEEALPALIKEYRALHLSMLAISVQADRADGRGVVTMERALDEIADIVRTALKGSTQ